MAKVSPECIKLTYSGKSQSGMYKIKAHSNRPIGPSWALFKGALLTSILQSADWKLKSMFCRFYFRELDVNVLKKLD